MARTPARHRGPLLCQLSYRRRLAVPLAVMGAGLRLVMSAGRT